MSTTVSVAVDQRNDQADIIARALDGGSIKIYSGTPPANADASLSGNTLLAELALSPTSAPAASSGQLTFNTVSDDTSANNSGVATFYRTFKSDGTTVVTQGTVGTSGESLNLDDVNIVATGTVSVSSYTHSVP